jgi:hypothetical protein
MTWLSSCLCKSSPEPSPGTSGTPSARPVTESNHHTGRNQKTRGTVYKAVYKVQTSLSMIQSPPPYKKDQTWPGKENTSEETINSASTTNDLTKDPARDTSEWKNECILHSLSGPGDDKGLRHAEMRLQFLVDTQQMQTVNTRSSILAECRKGQ